MRRDALLRDRDLALRVGLRDLVHDVEHDVLDDALEAACARLALDGLLRDGAQRVLLEHELDAVHREQFLILLHGRVLRLGQDAQQRVLVERLERADDGQAADDLGDDAVFHEILRTHLMDELVELRLLVLALHLGAKADGARLLQALRDDLLDADERAANDEEHISRVDLDGRRLGVLALAARRELDDAALEHLEQRLLHALMAGIRRDRVVRTRLARDLVELVKIDDAVLRLLDIFVRRVVEIAHGDLDIRADEAGLREARGVRHRERDVEELREMREQRRLAAARRAEHNDVRLLDLRAVIVLIAVLHALVVVVDRDGEHLLRVILVDDIFIEILLDDMRLVLLEHLVELVGERLFLRLRRRRVVLVEETVDLPHAVLADGKARVRIENRHIILVMHINDALAEAALMLDSFFLWHTCSFLKKELSSYYCPSEGFFQACLHRTFRCAIILQYWTLGVWFQGRCDRLFPRTGS